AAWNSSPQARFPPPIAAAAASARPGGKYRTHLHKIASICLDEGFFPRAISCSRSGLLTEESRWGYCLLIRERQVQGRALRLRFGANYVGRVRVDASDAAVVHIIGTQRHDRARLQYARHAGHDDI